MAELILPQVAVSFVLNRISKLLIDEYEVLGEAARHVEWIERELRSMQVLLEQVEQRIYSEQEEELKWAEKMKKTAVDAEDVIETFIIRSVKRRRRGILYWFEKYKAGKDLVRIRKEMADISQERMNLSTTHVDVSVETPGEASSSSTNIVAPAMAKLDHIVRENLFINNDDMKLVEGVKDELGYLQHLVSNLNSTGESERENVWFEEVKDICNYTSDVAGNFIARIDSWLKLDILRKILYVYEGYASAWEFKQKMELIRTQIGDAVRRMFTYGVGGKHMGMRDKQTTQRSTPIPNLSGNPSLRESFVWNVKLWNSMDRNLECAKRELALMSVFLSDTARAEGLNKRQQVWLSQLKHVAQNVHSLVAAARSQNGCLSSGMRFANAKDINSILKEIISISDRKRTFDIADIEGRREPSTQEINGEEDGVSSPAAASLYQPATGLKENVQSISEEGDLMAALLQDVQDTGELDGRSRIWVDQMRDVAPMVEYVIHKYHTILEHKPILIDIPKYIILKYKTRRVIRNKIVEIRYGIDEASRRRKTYDLDQFQSRAMVQISTQPSPVGEEESYKCIFGFEEDVDVLATQLMSDEKRRCITCIIGIHGIGKTTLAMCVYYYVAHIFDSIIWVSAKNLNPQEVINDIIIKEATLGSPTHYHQHHDVLETLARKRHLIVVDGIETCQSYLEALNRAIPDKSTASRLIFTTHSYSEATAAQEYSDTTFVHPLGLRDDDDSWGVFNKHLNLKGREKDNIPPQLIQVGREIVMKCGGLPSEIIKMSRLLSHVEFSQEEWSRVLSQQTEDRQRGLQTFHAVNTSLPLNLRKCLFYFVLFPDEFEIPVRRLVVLWVAEGLVLGGAGGEEGVPPERVAERYLTELIDRNIVQPTKRKRNGKVKACRLHSSLRQLWLTKANNESRRTNIQDRTAKISIIRQVADHLDQNDIWHDHIHGDTTRRYDSASLKTHYRDVVSFLSFDDQEGSKPGQQIGNFLNGCIENNCFLLLRVLDLERVYKPSLPKNIARLSRLRYLGLRWTYLDSLPSSIGSLLKLQTLDLKHTYIHTLPTSIWKMHLRHLFLSETFRTKFPPQKGKPNYLSDLQTLCGLFVDEETPLKGGLDTLVNITRLGLACQSMSLEEEEGGVIEDQLDEEGGAMEDQLKAVAGWIMKLKHLQSLTLKSRKENGKPSILHLNSFQNNQNLTDMYLLGRLTTSSVNLSQFPPTLVELTLSHSKLAHDPLEILKVFQKLRILSLLAESYTGETMKCESKSFPQLRVLKLWKLENLKGWEIEEGALPYLKELEIRSCPRLTMLPDGLQHVSTLHELKLTNVPILVDAYKRGEHKIPPKCKVLCQPSLQ